MKSGDPPVKTIVIVPSHKLKPDSSVPEAEMSVGHDDWLKEIPETRTKNR